MRNRPYTAIDKLKKLEYYQKNKKRERSRLIEWNDLNKLAVVNVLTNGEGTCRWCNQGDIDVLCIDHINNNGAVHRREVGYHSMAWWLIKNGYPPGFQVLCYNCNNKKKVLYGREKFRNSFRD